MIKSIKYGDIIRIHEMDRERSDSPLNGLIASKGFTDDTIYFLRYQNFQEVDDYRQSLFEIIPKSSFQIHNELLKTNLSPIQKQNLKLRAKTQEEHFHNNQRLLRGTDVIYGAEVLFRHLDSGDYLTGTFQAAATVGAFKLQLTKGLSTLLLFKLKSNRSYQREGDPIFYQDPLLLYHIKSDCYLNYNDKEVFFLDQEFQPWEFDQSDQANEIANFRPIIRKNGPSVKRYEAINQMKPYKLWQMQQHYDNISYADTLKIKAHDVIYLVHTRNKGYLSADLWKNQIFLKQANDLRDDHFYEAFWELCPADSEPGKFNLKHLFSGRMLVVQQGLAMLDYTPTIGNPQSIKKQLLIKVQASEPDKIDLYSKDLVNISFDSKKIDAVGAYPEKQDVSPIVKCCDDNHSKSELKLVGEMRQHSFRLFKLEKEYLSDVMLTLSCQQRLTKFIDLIKKSKKQQPQLWLNKRKVLWQKLSTRNITCQVQLALKTLLGWIYSKPYEQLEGNNDPPAHKSVQIFIQSGCSQIIVQMMYFLAQSNLSNKLLELCYKLLSSSDTQWSKCYLSRFLDLIFQQASVLKQPYIFSCLSSLLTNNYPAIDIFMQEDRVKKIVDFALGDVADVKYLRIFRTICVTERGPSIANQFRILQMFFTADKNKYHVNFKCENRIKFADNPQFDELERLGAMKQVLINFPEREPTSISVFFANQNELWNYFMQYVNLMADCCMGRNKEIAAQLKLLLPLQSILIILSDPGIKILSRDIIQSNKTKGTNFVNVYEPFVRFAHHCYIDSDRFTPIRLVSQVRYWYELRQQQDIRTTKTEFIGEKDLQEKKLLKMMMFWVRCFLLKFKQEINNPTDMQLLLTVLQLLKTTVLLGLWDKVDQFKEIINGLFLNVIKFDSGFLLTYGVDPERQTDREHVKEIVISNRDFIKISKPEVNLSIQCKILACDILEKMMMMESNIRISHMISFLKGMQECTVNFELYNRQPQLNQVSEEAKTREDYIIKLNQESSNNLGALLKGKKIKDEKDSMNQERIWVNKIAELTPYSVQEGDSRRFMFELIERPQFMVMTLMELTDHHNISLLNAVMKLITTVYRQRLNLVELFRETLIVCKGDFLKISQKIKEIRGKLIMLGTAPIQQFSQEGQKQLPYMLWKQYNSAIKDEKDRTGVIQDLGFLSLVFKNGVNIRNVQGLMSYYKYQNLGTVPPFPICNQCDEPNNLFQTLTAFLDVQNFLVSYLKRAGQPANQIQLKLTHAIFNCLNSLVWNNHRNRYNLQELAQVSLDYLQLNVGATQFLREFCKDNPRLLNSESLVNKIVERVLIAAANLKITEYPKSRLMMVLKNLCMLSGKGMKIIQKLIMCNFQNSRFSRLVFVENGDSITVDAFREWIQNYNINYLAALNSLEMEVSPQLSYIGSLFQAFMAMVQTRNLINIGKCRNMHPYLFLIGLLKSCKTCWVVLKALRGYTNRLYYIHVQVDVFLFQEFIRQEFPLIDSELEQLTELYLNHPDFEEVKIIRSSRYTYLGSYISSCLEEILISLKEMLEKPKFCQMLVEWLRKEEKEGRQKTTHDAIFAISQKIGFLLKSYKKMKGKAKKLTSFLNQIKRLLTEILKEMKINYLQDKCGKDVQPDAMEQQQLSVDTLKKKLYDHSKSFFTNLYEMLIQINKRKSREEALNQLNRRADGKNDAKMKFIDIAFAGNIQLKRRVHRPRIIQREKRQARQIKLQSNLVTSASRYFKIMARPKLSPDEQNLSVNEKIKGLGSMLLYSDSIKSVKEAEFQNLVNCFSEHDALSLDYYKKYCSENLSLNEFDAAVVPMKDVIKNIFKMNDLNPSGISDQNKITFIKMLRTYITESVQAGQHIKLDVDKWDSEYLGDAAKRLSEFQNLMVECGMGAFVCTILKEKLQDRLELLNEILLLCIAFLFGGNSNCQQSILVYLKQDEQNLMLVNLNEIIKYLGRVVVKITKIRQQKTLRKTEFNVIHQDNYDYYNLKEKQLERNFDYKADDNFENQKRVGLEGALCRSFRFLQLLCENNNVPMKNFVLAQINEDGCKKIASINFIETTTFLLRKLFKIMNKRMCRIPLFLLDFINQIAQIPCIQNQICLCKSSFFEDLCYMSTFFANKVNLQTRLFEEDDLPQLYQIYNKSIQLAISNLQGNDNRIYIQFVNKLQLKFLFSIVLRNLLQIINQVNQEQQEQEQLVLQNVDQAALTLILERQEARDKLFSQPIKNILSVFVILQKIKDFGLRMLKESKKSQDSVEAQQLSKRVMDYYKDFVTVGKTQYPHMREFCQTFRGLLLSIQVSTEIQGKSKNQFIYFPKQPVFNYLSAETKDFMMYEVNRQTSRDKLTGLIGFKTDVFTEIEWNYELNHYSLWGRPVQITSQIITDLRIKFGLLSLFICFLFTLFIEVDHDQRQKTSYYLNQTIIKRITINILSLIQLAGTTVFAILWLISRTHIALAKAQSQQGVPQETEASAPQAQAQGRMGQIMRSGKQSLGRLIGWLSTFKLWQQGAYVLHVFKSLFLYEGDFISILIFIMSSVLGTFVGTEYFTLHAFDFFGRVSIMQSIFSAIRTGAMQLVIVLLLGVVFIYVFSIVTFNTYVVSIYQDAYPQDGCQSVVGCILTLYTSGVINDSMDDFQIIRFTCDMVYFTFMEVLLGNIISGILIDTFSGLRQKKEEIDSDKANFCFICNKAKSDVEKQGQMTFQQHIQIHFLWNYAFYIYCLQRKDETDYTGIEYDIKNKIDEEAVDWFPLIKEDADIQTKIKQISSTVEEAVVAMGETTNKSLEMSKGLVK